MPAFPIKLVVSSEMLYYAKASKDPPGPHSHVDQLLPPNTLTRRFFGSWIMSHSPPTRTGAPWGYRWCVTHPPNTSQQTAGTQQMFAG